MAKFDNWQIRIYSEELRPRVEESFPGATIKVCKISLRSRLAAAWDAFRTVERRIEVQDPPETNHGI